MGGFKIWMLEIENWTFFHDLTPQMCRKEVTKLFILTDQVTCPYNQGRLYNLTTMCFLCKQTPQQIIQSITMYIVLQISYHYTILETLYLKMTLSITFAKTKFKCET